MDRNFKDKRHHSKWVNSPLEVLLISSVAKLVAFRGLPPPASMRTTASCTWWRKGCLFRQSSREYLACHAVRDRRPLKSFFQNSALFVKSCVKSLPGLLTLDDAGDHEDDADDEGTDALSVVDRAVILGRAVLVFLDYDRVDLLELGGVSEFQTAASHVRQVRASTSSSPRAPTAEIVFNF